VPSFAPYEPPAAQRDARPAVIGWYRAYAAFMAALYLALALALALAAGALTGSSLILALALALALLYAVAACVPRTPWGWTVALVAIAVGVASGAFVLAVPLLVHWYKPLTKAAFARL
jgi:hypothetical protein